MLASSVYWCVHTHLFIFVVYVLCSCVSELCFDPPSELLVLCFALYVLLHVFHVFGLHALNFAFHVNFLCFALYDYL